MFDLLIRNAFIVDGTGQPGWYGDVGVTGDKISAVERDIEAEAVRSINANGHVLAPGFLDPHSHWDATHLQGGKGEIKLQQGVCLDLVGNCGESLTPCSSEKYRDVRQLFHGNEEFVVPRSFDDYISDIDNARPGLRVMSHVGHGTLRIQAMGHSSGPPSPDQLAAMRDQLSSALEAGAAGLSTGLYYTPSGFADSEELTALMEVVAVKGGFHASHIRNEANGIRQALEEVIEVGLNTGAATHISHLKLAGKSNWNKVDEITALFEQAQKSGLDLTCDVYPYNHSCTTLLSLVPPWSLDGGIAAFCKRMNSPGDRDIISNQIHNGYPGWESGVQNSGYGGITISSVHSGNHAELIGLSLLEAADQKKMAPEQLITRLIEEESGSVSIICASMSEEVVSHFIRFPFAMIGSDGALSEGRPHPRAYGAFPRVIRRFVRELKVLSLEEAIHKMSLKTAERLRLQDCGVIAPGRRADLVLFDSATFGDTATFEEPQHYSTGLHHVFLAGCEVWPNRNDTHYPGGGFLKAPRYNH